MADGLAISRIRQVVGCRGGDIGIRGPEVIEIEGTVNLVLLVHRVVQLAESDVLTLKSREGAEIANDISVGRRAGGRRDRRQAGLRIGAAAGIRDGIDLARTVIGQKIKQLVFDNGPAHAGAKLLLLVNRLGIDALRFLQRVEGVQRRITQVIKQVAMDLVGAGFGHRVDNPAGRLPQLSRIVAGSHLVFLDRVEAIHIR